MIDDLLAVLFVILVWPLPWQWPFWSTENLPPVRIVLDLEKVSEIGASVPCAEMSSFVSSIEIRLRMDNERR